jgi:hypothetical protein
VHEERARRIGLERLDEAGLQRLFDVGVDGPGPGFHHPFAGIVQAGVEGQRRAEGDHGVVVVGEVHQPRLAVGARQRDHRVGGAEVDADSRRAHAQSPDAERPAPGKGASA